MKTIMLTLALILSGLSQSLAFPIFSIERSNKGIFGFRNVSFYRVTNSAGQSGWVGHCSEPGLDKCRPSGGLTDTNDDFYGNQLIDLADAKIEAGVFTGTSKLNVKVQGEKTMRVYTVTWSTDKKGNGRIDVDRTDI